MTFKVGKDQGPKEMLPIKEHLEPPDKGRVSIEMFVN